jgi:hypothetical protein
MAQEEATFKLRVATGYAGRMPRQWGDTKTWTVDVRPSDTLAELLKKIETATGGYRVPSSPSDFLVGATPATKLVSDHTNLPDPRLEATVGQNVCSARLPHHLLPQH